MSAGTSTLKRKSQGQKGNQGHFVCRCQRDGDHKYKQQRQCVMLNVITRQEINVFELPNIFSQVKVAIKEYLNECWHVQSNMATTRSKILPRAFWQCVKRRNSSHFGFNPTKKSFNPNVLCEAVLDTLDKEDWVQDKKGKKKLSASPKRYLWPKD